MTTEASVTFSSCFLTATMRPVTGAPLGITVFPSTLIVEVRLPAKVSPTLFLLLASVWPTIALIAVPFGTVTIAAGGGALLAATGLGAAVLLGVLAAPLVAVFEQPATVKTAAKASQRLRWT